MPKRAAPWYRTQDGWWCVWVRRDGKRIPEKLAEGRENEAEAYRAFHRLMASDAKPEPQAAALRNSVRWVINHFLVDLKAHCESKRTLKWYWRFCKSFCKSIPREMMVDDLKPFHIRDWIASKPKWTSNNTRRGAVQSVRRAFRWAVEQGRIEKNPLVGLTAPAPRAREVVIDDQEFAKLIGFVRDHQFKDLVWFVRSAGCRPQEVVLIQRKHVDLTARIVVFAVIDSKGKKRVRVIYLADKSLEIASRLLERRSPKPDDYVFRNTRGKPWNSNAISSRFFRLKKKIGKRICLYNLRHTFTTNSLKKGVDPVTLAVLLGHTDTSTLARVYQHLGQDVQHMVEQANRCG